MPAVRKLPDNEVLQRLVNQGFKYGQIGAMYSVGEQAVYRQMQRANKTRPRADRKSFIPWKVATQHNRCKVINNLRALAAKEAGETLEVGEARRLELWLQQLREADVVVCYDRNQPPTPGNPKGGFYYSKRRPSDDPGSIVRPPVAEGAENPRATV